MPDLTPPRQSPTLHDRIQGALENLGHRVSDTTVGNILKAHGIEPAPRRKHQTTWKTFIKAHWEVLAARSTSRPRKCGRPKGWSRIPSCS